MVGSSVLGALMMRIIFALVVKGLHIFMMYRQTTLKLIFLQF